MSPALSSRFLDLSHAGYLPGIPGILSERRIEPAIQYLPQYSRCRSAQTQRQYVRVIPDAGPLCRLSIAAQGSAYAGRLVGHNRATCARPAQHDGLIRLTAPNRPDRLQGHLRPICRIVFRFGSEVQRFMPPLLKFFEQGFDERQPFVRTDRNAHEIGETDYEYRERGTERKTIRQTQPDTSCSLVNQWYGD